jgi:large subunit ribosomal protein L31
MKNEIHPQYFATAKIVCACGNSFITGSTQQELHVEICYNCHPFYTGKQNLIDTSGTISRNAHPRLLNLNPNGLPKN